MLGRRVKTNAQIDVEPPTPSDTSGVASAIAAYALWGLLPLFFKLLATVPPLQILSHRIIWSLGLLLVLAFATGRWRAIRRALASRRLRLMLLGSASLIAANWLIYIWAVLNGHVLEASLGYFINPLVNVALGMAVLGERLRRLQAVAVGLAALGVTILAVAGTGSIWISLSLALTFASYGLIRKLAPIDALGGLLGETLILGLPALVVLGWAAANGTGSFVASEPGLDALLILSGAVTATPLLLFAAATKRMRYSTLGLFQYIAPTLQFAQAVLLFGEPFQTRHFLTFGCIWAGCALYAADTVRGLRRLPAERVVPLD